MQCPACGRPMEPYRLTGLEVDRCQVCSVVWFDARELKRFLSLVDRPRPEESAPVPEQPPAEAVRCPRCPGQPLERAHWRQFPLAVCGRCSGILLTYTALAALRLTWARLPRQSPEFQLRIPEALPDGLAYPAHVILDAVFGLL